MKRFPGPPAVGAPSAYRIALLPGDGVGPEVMAEARLTLEAVAALHGEFAVLVESFDVGAEHYLRTGSPMDSGTLERLAEFDAILAGPFGDRRVPDAPVLWGTILAMRHRFDQYVNVRRARLLPGIESPLRTADLGGADIVVVRENTEGEYSGVGGRLHRGRGSEVAIDSAVFTRTGVERVVRFAFSYARAHGRTLVTSATKSNALPNSMVLWDEVFNEVGEEFPAIRRESALIDALAARVVMAPSSLDVVVASNLFGDILSDLTAAVVGGLGVAPSANLDPTRANPSLFQAIHGSAPDIAGKGVANPIGEILSVALMLEFLGEPGASASIEAAVAASTATPASRTHDLGGTAGTSEAGDAIRALLCRHNG